MYLDTDVLLALLKEEDWLQADVESATFDEPKTSIVTAVEIQLVMFDPWKRTDLATIHDEITGLGIDVCPLTSDVFRAGAELLPAYPELNVFDAIHVGHAQTLDELLVSTDTLYPKIEDIENVDPRDM